MKKPLSPQINVARKVLGFWQQNLARVNIDVLGGAGGVKGEDLEFEKLSRFLNLLDFQLLSQQVLSRAVGYFLCKNCTPHPHSLSHQTPLKIKVLCQALFYFKIW